MPPNELLITVYVSNKDRETLELLDLLERELSGNYGGRWKIETVDVLVAPEKALKNDVFATPTVVRELPPPVVKLLGRLRDAPNLFTVLTTVTEDQNVIIL